VLVVLVALAAAWLLIDRIAKVGIEQGAGYALGVKTTVDSVSLSLLKGQMTVNNLDVGNPPGYETPHLMQTDRIAVEVQPGSLLTNTIRVPKFEIDGLDMNIEQKVGENNVSVIMGNVERLGSSGGKPEEKKPEKKGGGKKVQVDKITIRKVVAHVQLLPVGGKASTLDIKVDEIPLEGVTSDNAAGVAVPELVSRIVPAIIEAVLAKGKGVIPSDLAGSLSKDVASAVESLGQGAANLTGQARENVTKALQGMGEAINKNVGEAAKGAGEATKGVGDALKGILGGHKQEQEK
jgi:hypothetical protein